MRFLLYGAYGYTGKLIARMAKDHGLEPVLAGRSAEKLQALANETGYDYLAFSLDDQDTLDKHLADFSVVLHAAGPYKYTAKPMVEACLRTGTHYVDITGEIEVFELIHGYDTVAQDAEITLLPGAGFDVVPTDCMALYLKKQLPDATHLKLAFASSGGGPSRGTAMTMVESLGKPGARRRNGRIEKVPLGHAGMAVPFPDKDRFVMAIPWGDVSTAYYTTGIPNIETFIGMHPKTYKRLKYQKLFNWLLRTQFIKNTARRRINKAPAGPSDAQRAKARSLVWGKVWNEAGETREASLITPDGYTLTAISSLMITKEILDGHTSPGFQTPAGAFGEDFVLQIEHVQREDIW